MANIKVNDKVVLTDEASEKLMYPDGIEFTVKDILETNIPYNIVIGTEEFGKDWSGFVCLEELKLVE